MERCRLSVFAAATGRRSPGAVQSCKAAFLYLDGKESVVAVAEGPSVFVVRLPEQMATLSALEGKPFRLQPGFVAAQTNLIASFSSQVDIESLTVADQGRDSWKLVAWNGLGESLFCDVSGLVREFPASQNRSVSWAGGLLDPSEHQIISVHQSAKSLVQTDLQTGQQLRELCSVFYPTSITSTEGGSSTFITTEYNQVCLWDLRGKNACTERMPVRESPAIMRLLISTRLPQAGCMLLLHPTIK
jgi:hypothetical protein